MNKEEAIKVLNARPYTGEVREALETLIPELKESEESEEERVRKDIVGLIKFALNDGSAVSPGSHTTKEEAISWLEKQKEQKPFWNPTEEDVVLFNKAITTNMTLTPQERAKLDIIRMKFKHCPYIEQKEQKTAGWSEEDEKIIDTIVSVLGQYVDYKAVSGTGSGYATPRYNKEIAWLKSIRPQSKIHYWTEEEIEPIISDYLTGKEHYGGMIARLRCLKPKSSWKPSEEELVALKRAGGILHDYGHSELAKMVFMIEGELANLPVLNKSMWKPSEEQMKALNALNLYGNLSYVGQQNQLISLYQDLKKLM